MKKTVLLLALTFSLLSCSSDSSNKELTVNYKNMVGVWVYTTVIKSDGTEIPYNHLCSTNKDYASITSFLAISSYFYVPSCDSNFEICTDYGLDGNKLLNCNEAFQYARVTSLTTTTMKLEYDQYTLFGSLVEPPKGLILKKR